MKTRTKIIAGILVLLLSASLCVSCYEIWHELTQQKKEKDDFSDLAELVEITAPPETQPPETEEEEIEQTPAPETEEAIPAHKHDMLQLKGKNGECVAWLSIPDTAIDYPVMHTPDIPQKYLRLNFYGEYSQSGVPFLDFRCTAESDNLITFGHNMKNGTMYSELRGYADKTFCDEHPTVEWETEDGIRYFSIFAVATVNKRDDWYAFINAEDAEDFDSHINTLEKKALYITESTPEYGEQLLTLSTCYGSSKDGRLIVVAVEKLS